MQTNVQSRILSNAVLLTLRSFHFIRELFKLYVQNVNVNVEKNIFANKIKRLLFQYDYFSNLFKTRSVVKIYPETCPVKMFKTFEIIHNLSEGQLR